MRAGSSHAGALAALFLVLAARPVAAQPSKADVARADALFTEGKAAMRAGTYDVACTKFAESDRIDPAPGTLRNLAECEEKRGHLVVAAKQLRQAIERKPEPDILQLCEKQLSSLEQRTPKLMVRLPQNAPPGSVAKLDGVELPPGDKNAGLTVPVDPGTHAVKLLAPGRYATEETVAVREGQTERVFLVLGAAREGAGEATTEAVESASGQRTFGYVAAGVGVTGVAVAVYSYLKLSSQAAACKSAETVTEECREQSKSSNPLQLTEKVGAGIGVLGLAVGGYLLFSTDSPGMSSISMGITPRGVTLGGRF